MRSKIAFLALVPIWVTTTSFKEQGVKVWEKPIAPGLIYHMELESDPPRMIHALRVVATSPVVSTMPELAGKTVYEGEGKGQGKVSDMVKESGAIAAINADFFPFTGDPLGLMVRRGNLVSLPNPKRVAFAWGPQTSVFGFARFSGAVVTDDKREISFEGFNEECPENKITLNTPDAGISKAKSPCLTVILKVDGAQIAPTTQIGATVVGTTNDGANLPLGDGKFTLVAHGNKMSQLNGIKAGQRLTIKTSTSGFDWLKLENAVGGGPFVLRDNEIFIDAENEGFGDNFANTRHPRTALGRTPEGDWMFVAVDGRQTMSVGATLQEMGEIMQRLGCRDAINLDGGGSTCLNILGMNVNRPSDKTGERPVANGVVFYGPRVPMVESKMKLSLPTSVAIGGKGTAKVLDSAGKEIPNIEVVWSVQGPAWIDQGGMLHGLEVGIADVKAYVRGATVTARVAVK
jgi:exopolysaccharide biosynthesis protein